MNIHITLSRFLYAPHSLAELIGAIFGWMLLAVLPELAIAFGEWLLTPDYEHRDLNHRYGPVFVPCLLYVIFFFAEVFPSYCVFPCTSSNTLVS